MVITLVHLIMLTPSNFIGHFLTTVQALIKENYFDWNLFHLAEQLAINENIVVKRETLRGWAHDIHHVKRAKRRRSNVRKRRELMETPVLMMQMDGSPHRWFGDNKHCLIIMIDDATSEVHGEFFHLKLPMLAWRKCENALKWRAYLKSFMLTGRIYSAAQSVVTSLKCNAPVKS